VEAVRKVQRAVNDVEAWCQKWRLCLNGDKSQLVLISRASKKSAYFCILLHTSAYFCLLLFDDVVRPVPTAKFLGVLIDERLNFKEHLVDIERRERNRLNVLKALAWGGIDPKTLIGLYGIYCRPIIEYGSMVFVQISKTAMASLQKVQNDAIRICLRLPRYISIETLHKSACLPRVDERLLQLGSKLL
jgi:hypothetical protein